ncbi:putative recombinase [Streptomyces violaceusniger Tu 4113]|uniref:Recombinase n=1 Tax=Streptomyces violaceusniger (strain Tu 4113) TaxID=653045 RepID=G2PFC2_STRV4|nr:putative recombinase [Streptomyces violaceusniger Tu 4113]
MLAEAASEEQVRQVRNARKARARRLRADLKAAAKLRRSRFQAVTSAVAPERLGTLTAAEAEAELRAQPASNRRETNPGYIPPPPVPEGWARPVQPQDAPSEPGTPQKHA